MLDRLNLPASLRHLIEKRIRNKDRRERERRASTAEPATPSPTTGQLAPNEEPAEQRGTTDRRVKPRRTRD